MVDRIALFDANACVGKPAAGGSDFPTVAARLAHMDRLGISRALVWNTESVQDNALASNRRLLDEVAATPGARERIVPALAVSGLTTYERDGIQAFRKQMQDAGTRALRFVNVFGHLSLVQCEPVIRGVRDLKPFVVTTCTETSARDVLEFTGMFPDVPIILTDVIWGQGIGVFDLMRRRKNVILETSWVHTWEGVRLAVQQFGPDRVVFGMGHRSHNGAAIAALYHADISDEARRHIACGNLDRLCGSPTEAMGPGSAAEDDGLWARHLAGRPLGVNMIDAHAHLGGSGGYVLEVQDEEGQIPLALRTMDRLGQNMMIFSGMQALLGAAVTGNDLMDRLLQPHADRMKAYVGFNPHYADDILPRLDNYFAGPVFIGLKLICSYWRVPVTDPRFRPMWEYADRHALPVLLHTWDGGYDSPAMLHDIVKLYPNVSFLCGHSGGGNKGRHEAQELAAEFPNVYLEWCGSFCSTVRWEDTLKKVSPGQIVFGTDAMAHDVDWELGRLLSVDAPDETLAPILGQNMGRILAMRK